MIITQLGDALTTHLDLSQLIELTVIIGMVGRDHALPQAVYDDLVRFLEEEHGLDALSGSWILKADVNYHDFVDASVAQLDSGDWIEVEVGEIRAEYDYEA